MDFTPPTNRRPLRPARKVKRSHAVGRGVAPVVESLERRQLMSVPNGPFALSISADAGTGQATLKWYDSHSNETGYKVERSSGDGEYAVIATLDATATSYTDLNLSNDSQYTYHVYAYNASGVSSITYAGPISLGSASGGAAPITTVLAGTVPDGPFAFSASASSATQVNIAWYDSHSNETGYDVERATGSGAYTIIATLGASATSYTDTTASPSTQYAYRVYAVNAYGVSNNTGGAATTPDAITTTPVVVPPVSVPVTTVTTPVTTPVTTTATSVPDGPFALSAVAASATQVNLAWYDAHSNETGYAVERQTATTASTVVATLGPTATTYSDTPLAPSTRYTYRVYAYNGAGVSNVNSAVVTTPSVGGVLSSSGGSSSTTSPAGYFPVGVFYQPTYSFSTWASRGVNLLYGYEKGAGDSMATWDAAAAAAGMKEIRQPAGTPAADANVANLTAWLAPQDEPDLNGVSPATLATQYASLKAAASNIPVITTYAGGDLLGWQGGTTAATYAQYAAATDMTAADVYPVTGWGLTDVSAVGKVVDKLTALAPAKKSYAFIETSNQQLSWIPNDTGVTAAQLRGELWDSVIHGASGVVYFPQQIGNGFSFDATPASVVAEMTTQDAKLQSYGAALNSTANPSSVNVTTTGSVETTWRVYGGHTYIFALNLSANTVTGQALNVKGISPNTTLSVDGENRTVTVNATTVTDSFAPYALHVYVA